MKIKKILNNNVVIAEDSKSGREKIVMSNGIGFRNKVGDCFEQDDSQKIFVLSDELYEKYEELTANISPLAAEIAEEVITYGVKEKGLELNELIHLTLTDHIDGVLSRLKKGFSLSNQLTMEIRRVYGTEFDIGLYAVRLLEEKTGCEVLQDEAAFIAMHFLNNRMDLLSTENEIRTVVKFVTDTIKIVETYYHKTFDENSFAYYRFVMHLKGLAQRIYTGSLYKDDPMLYETVSVAYPEAAKCAEKVVKVLTIKYKRELSSEEKAYLILYIEKLNRE